MSTRKRFIVGFGAAALAILWSATLMAAHPKPRAYRHATRHTAVIVVGKPRPAQRVVVVNGARHGALDLNVKPKSTQVWVNGKLRGTCDDFDGFPAKLTLPAGMHTLRLVTPHGDDVSRHLRVRAGVEVNVGLDLR